MSIFLTLLEFHFSGLKLFFSIQNIKKCFFLAFFAKKKNIWEKGRFFEENHLLTPLQNVDFFWLCENFTFEVQKALFSIQNIKKCFFLPFFAKKKHIRKRSIFCQKPWTKPFENVNFFDSPRTLLFRSKKHSLLFRI